MTLWSIQILVTKKDLFYLTDFLVCSFYKSQVQFLRPEEIKKLIHVWLVKTVRKLENHCTFLPCADFVLYMFGFYKLTYPLWYLSLIGSSATCPFSVIFFPISSCKSQWVYLDLPQQRSLLQWVKPNSSCKVSKSLLKLQVKQIPLPYCLHAFVMKESSTRFSKHAHTFRDSTFSLFSYHSWGSGL